MASGHTDSKIQGSHLIEVPLGASLKNRYVVEQQLGAGTSARVYRCRDTMLGNLPVAIKIYPPDIISDSLSAGRVNRELLSSHGIDHPNVARFYECIRADDFIGMVMEYVPGRTLEDLLLSGEEFTLMEVTHILKQMILGLAAIHGAGVLHRDMKPANIIITNNGAVKITDFGLAKRDQLTTDDGGTLGGSGDSTGGDDAVGTPMYLSPEYLEHGICDYRSDVYALGVMAYEMVTGEEPFPFVNMFQFVEAKINTSPVPPHQVNKLCPPELGVLIKRMMDNDPERRFQTAREVEQAFSVFMRRQNVSQASSTKLTGSFEALGDDPSTPDIDESKILRGRRLHTPTVTEPDVFSGMGGLLEGAPQFIKENLTALVVISLLFLLSLAVMVAFAMGMVDLEGTKESLERLLSNL